MLWGMRSVTISDRVTHIGVGGRVDQLTTVAISKEAAEDIRTTLHHNSER